MMKHTKHFNPSFITMIEEDGTYHGHWWLPSAPEDKIAGVLYLKKKGGVRLHLMGMFKLDETNQLGLRLTDHEVILGELIPGDSIATLIDCHERERESPYISNTAKGSVQRFIAKHLLFGRHIPTLNEVVFSSFEFSTTYLSDWVNVRLLDIEFKGKSTVVTSLPNERLAIKGDGYELTITSYVNTSLGGNYNSTQHSSISVDVTSPISWSDFEENFQKPLLDLVQFGSLFLNSITFQNISHDDDTLKMISAGRFEQITRAKDFGIHEAMFLLSDLGADAPAFIISWLDFYKRFRHIFSLYFDSAHIGFQFPVSRFLNVMQAVESYHAERKETPFVAARKNEFKKKKQTVIDCLQEKFSELGEWIKDEFSYFTVLRTRLEELITEAGSVMDIVGDHGLFISRVMDSRNYYTHYNPKKKTKAAVDMELSTMTEVLRLLLSFHILTSCGMEKDNAIKLLKERQYLRSVKNVIKDHRLWIKAGDEQMDEED